MARRGAPAPCLWRTHGPVLIAVSVLFALLCVAPYLVARTVTERDRQFTGILLNHIDQGYYQAAQRSVADGLDRRNRFTSEPDAPGPISPMYPLLGHIERITHLPPGVTYHLPNAVGAVALPIVLAWVFSLCFPRRPELAIVALVLALFGAGMARLAPGFPAMARAGDNVPESNALASVATFPHFAIAWVGMALAAAAFLSAMAHRRWHVPLAAGVGAGLCIGLSHTFLLAPILLAGGALGVVTVVQAFARRAPAWAWATARKTALAGAGILLAALPFVAALASEQRRFDDMSQLSFPAAVSDTWWTWVLGFGIVSPLAAWGLARVLRRPRTSPAALFLVAWVVVQTSLLYLPVTPFLRRYSEALVIPLAGLAAIGVADIARRVRVNVSVIAGMLAGAQLVGSVLVVAYLGRYGFTMDAPTRSVMARFAADEVVLAGDELSFVIPAYSPATVYVARVVETMDYPEKIAKRGRWAADPTAPDARAWLIEAGLTTVVVDAHDPTFDVTVADPASACLEPARSLARYRVFRVVRPCPAPETAPDI